MKQDKKRKKKETSEDMIQEKSIKRMKEKERERDNDSQVLSLSGFLYYQQEDFKVLRNVRLCNFLYWLC